MLNVNKICRNFQEIVIERLKRNNNADNVEIEWTAINEEILEIVKEHVGTMKKEKIRHICHKIKNDLKGSTSSSINTLLWKGFKIRAIEYSYKCL